MSTLFVELMGDTAGFLTTVSFVPQVVKVLRDRDTSAISLPMYVVFTTGIFFWLVYGIFLHSAPILIANIVTFVLASAVLVLKITLEWRARLHSGPPSPPL